MKGGGKRRAGPGVVARSLVQTAFFVVTVTIWGLLAPLVLWAVPYRRRYWLITRWTHLNLWWLEKVCGIRCQVEGLENIPEEAGIVLCKHQSTWETMALQRWFNPQTWVLKRELIRTPFFGWGLAALRPIAIDRSARAEAMKQLCDQGQARLKAGIWVIVFPEGTRVEPGTRGRYKPGGGVLAERTGAPVVPVAHNAGEFWGRNRIVKFPGVIQVRIGKPIDPAGKSSAEITRLAEEWIEAQMAEISQQEAHD